MRLAVEAAHIAEQRAAWSKPVNARLVLGACQDLFDKAVVVSRRAELAHAVCAARTLGKHVDAMFFRYLGETANPLAAVANSDRVIELDHVRRHHLVTPTPSFAAPG